MKCNYKPPKLTKEEQQEMASMKSTLPYIDRLHIEQREPKESRMKNNEEVCNRSNQFLTRLL